MKILLQSFTSLARRARYVTLAIATVLSFTAMPAMAKDAIRIGAVTSVGTCQHFPNTRCEISM